jgi:hypothetical protein
LRGVLALDGMHSELFQFLGDFGFLQMLLLLFNLEERNILISV